MIRFRVEDQESVRSLEIALDYITVGRAPGCTIPLVDPGVGRFHASLQRDGTRLRLVTSGRGSGTWVNGSPVEDTAELRVGDRVTFGRTHITLEAFLPGKRVPAPSLPDLPEPALPPDTALGSGEDRSLFDTSRIFSVLRRRSEAPRAAAASSRGPAAPSPVEPETAEPPPAGTVPVSEGTVGFSTELLREPGSRGEEEARALRRILEINKRLARETDEDRLLDRILDAAVELTGADRGLVLLHPAGGGEEAEPEVRCERGGAGTDRGGWAAAVRRVLATGRSIRLEGDPGDPSARTLLSVPLKGEQGVLGVLHLDRAVGEGAFPVRAALLLEAFADQSSLALQTARLVRENRARSEELEAARARLEEANRALEEALRRRTVELEDARRSAALARSELGLKYTYDRIVGRSPAMRTLLSLVDKVTESAVPVLIEGESGTGKELVARAIHFNGARGARPFVVENCAAVPDPLIENELFGHEKGAFTGADRAQEGLFERADGGTLFLDEVGDMSFEMQKKLLRVLQDGEVRRVGGKTTRTVDVRVLCATNRDLARMVKEGKFREDLFYRLCVVRVRIPPLRERREDVPLLAAHFLDRVAEEGDGRAPRMEADALDALTAYPWPGNVRELENEIRRAATLAEGTITREVLSPHVRESRRAAPGDAPAMELPPGAGPFPGDPAGAAAGRTLREAVEALERTLVVEALREAGGNKTRTASALGLSRLGLRKKMARYGIDG